MWEQHSCKYFCAAMAFWWTCVIPAVQQEC